MVYCWGHPGGLDDPNGGWFCEECKQRRRDFFHLMRRSDAGPLRMLLAYLRWNEGVDWREITGLKLDTIDPDSFIQWIARVQHEPGTSERMVIAYGFSSINDLFTDWFHIADPACTCEACMFVPVAR